MTKEGGIQNSQAMWQAGFSPFSDGPATRLESTPVSYAGYFLLAMREKRRRRARLKRRKKKLNRRSKPRNDCYTGRDPGAPYQIMLNTISPGEIKTISCLHCAFTPGFTLLEEKRRIDW